MAYQILVVDNQREASKMIRTGIQTLGTDFNVATAMSGEEALLEARLRKFDLVISEVRLPGMSGVELVRKLRSAKPDTKAILVTHSIDRYIRREAADVGIENLLQKPLEISEMLNEVQRVLGLGGQSAPVVQEEIALNTEPISISDRLASLRQELEASFTFLLSPTGEILMQAGDHQSLGLEAEISSLLAVFSAGHRMARLLGAAVPDNFYTFTGTRLDVFMTHVGDSHALLIGMPATGNILTQMDKIYQVIQKGTHDLQAILMDMGVALTTPTEPLPDEPTLQEAHRELEEGFELDSALDALFTTVDKASLKTEMNSFWEVSSIDDTGIFANADALSYEQAKQLGLAPDEELK
ncbi:MAG: hypothetical protein Fur0022_24690 [Anaerolineales bacterium]